MVRKEILNLNANKSCSLDEINHRLIIELVDIIAMPIAILLHKLMERGDMPDDWKRAIISPISPKWLETEQWTTAQLV